MAKENNIPTGLYWQGKKTEVERISLPFQTIETVNERRATREKDKETPLLRKALIPLEKGVKLGWDDRWYNRLIWGESKYVFPVLIAEL
jgi:hypothetical protein